MKLDTKITSLLIFIVSALILAMCSCKYDNNNTTDSTFYGNNMDVKKVSTVELDAHILHLSLPNTTQMSMSRVIYLEYLINEDIVKCIRLSDNNYYSVTPIQVDNSIEYLFLLYDTDAYILVDGMLTTKLLDKDAFSEISTLTTFSEVRNIDKSSKIIDGYSYHHLDNRSVLRISYIQTDTSETLIEKYECFKTSKSILDYLLPQDIALVE